VNEDRSHQFGRYLGDHLPSWLLREPVFSVSTVVRFEDRRRSEEPFPLPNRESRHTPPSPVFENVEYTPLHLHSDMFMDPGHARRPVLDVIVDIRFGSPTFGEWESVRLDDQAHHAVYLSEGLGHAFLALTDDATVVYLCSEGYQPDREHGIHPLDPDLGIEWPDGLPFLMSPKDAEAPTLASAARSGLLPAYERCAAFRRGLRGN